LSSSVASLHAQVKEKCLYLRPSVLLEEAFLGALRSLCSYSGPRPMGMNP
jgi:hypothetical protein